MTNRASATTISHGHLRRFDRTALLVGVSIMAMLMANPEAHAKPIGNWSAAPSAAAIAAAQSGSQEAARAARDANNALKRATLAIQAMQSTQQAARDAARAALNAMPAVPNGLGVGGLQIRAGVKQPDGSVDSNLWQGANLPTQFTDGDRTKVNISQTQQKAILTWDTFNIGAKTDLNFDQHGNRNWVALNRVLGVDARPSQILGNITADGSVYVINQNGIIFGGTSQVNVGTLIASSANISNDQFISKGIYSTQVGATYVPSFTGATGAITVEAGASIETKAPSAVTSGGGFVLLMGKTVSNSGSISTPVGQAMLAAGDDFVLRRGFGTDANITSTTRGNEISTGTWTPNGSGGGTWINGGGSVSNDGIIFSQQGDITLAGRTIAQNGILVASTSVNARGTIHLLNSASDTLGSITLGADSVTTVIPELESADTALNAQRDALITASTAANLARAGAVIGQFDNLSALADRQDQSRIEIVTGGDVIFKGGATPDTGSLTIAQGSQVAVSAGKRVFTESGATIDVSGVRDVVLAMSSNNIMVNVQGNELRDSPANRDNGFLANSDVWVDIRDLIFVPAGTGGYASDRYYTPGGLLEVGGYLANTKHTIGEWASVGGTITLSAPEVIAQKGSVFDISGGSVKYDGGYITTTNFLGSDGRLYNINNADANMTFVGLGEGFVIKNERWGITAVWTSPFNRGRTSTRWEDGYTVGRDAGQLIISAPTSVFEGKILADVVTGDRQLNARPEGVSDGYKLGQNQAALAGTLAYGHYDARGLVDGSTTAVTIGDIASVTDGMSATDALPSDRSNTAYFDAGLLNDAHLGGLTIASTKDISVDAPLTLANGGEITFTAPNINLNADITAHSGSVALGNIMSALLVQGQLVQWWRLVDTNGKSQVTIGGNSTIDLTGLWTNARRDPNDTSGLAYLNGGTLDVSTTGGITLAAGSLVDLSSGGAILANGKTQGGKGGSVSLITNNYAHLDRNLFTADRTAPLVFDGNVRAYGFNGGGTLTLSAPQKIVIGDTGSATVGGVINLDTDLFATGFTHYDITGIGGIEISDGTTIAPTVPVYRFTDASYTAPTGGPTTGELWLPPTYLANPLTDTVTQRIGADLTLVTTRGDFTLPQNAAITVDPGHAVDIYANGQTTIDGHITARGGEILIAGAQETAGEWRTLGGTGHFSLTRSIWIGENAVLDASGDTAVYTDARGRSYGAVSDGGSIELGGANGAASDAFVIIRPGAVLDASGTSAVIDVSDGETFTPTLVASDGGLIALNSNSGIYIDGDLRAAAGGAGASGGALSMNLVSRRYVPIMPTAQGPDDSIGTVPDALRKLRNITITQQREASGLSGGVQAGQADAGLLFGSATISADQVAQGGFASLALHTSDLFVFKGDVNLSLARSLSLGGGIFSVADATPNINVVLNAPYVKIDGFTEDHVGGAFYNPGLVSVGLDGILQSTNFNSSTFSVAADLLDITGGVSFGASGVQGSGNVRWVSDTDSTPSDGAIVDAGGFAQVSLTSRGDIRLGNGRLSTDLAAQPGGWIKTSGDLNLTAAQIYPLSGASVSIYAGVIGVQGNETFDPARPKTIKIRRSSDDIPQQPGSVFGDLSLIAATIDQGGVVRAPLGTVNFNSRPDIFTATPATTEVIFRAGSVTSASANGLIMPFGGTSDGTSYQGADGTLVDLGSALVSTPTNGAVIATGISVTATSVVGEKGALLDLSGGGSLTGAGFVSGRGGSVDTLKTPLINSNPANTFSSAGNKVYAIMPGYASAYAPVIATIGAGDPAIGRQITIPAGVPGLPAGTYTLLPSSYALLPGAFRVEIGAQGARSIAPNAMPNGSYVASGIMSVANTGIQDSLPTQIILTAGKTVRSYSQYNETSYADFARNQAALFGNVRPRLPDDGKILRFNIGASTGVPSLTFAGRANFDPTDDGIAGGLLITSSAPSNIIDITASGAAPIIGHTSVSSDDLNAFHAATLFVGGAYLYSDDGKGNGPLVSLGGTSTINVLDGADLRAGQVFLVGPNINVAGGATIDTRGQGTTGIDSSLGYAFLGGGVLAVANGWLNFLPGSGTGHMNIASGASLLTEGTIMLGAPGGLTMGDVNFGARYLTVTQDQINVGDADALAAAQAAGVLVPGWNLNQATLDKLLHPSSTAGVPALERLTLTAGGAISLFGSVTLDARSQSESDVEFVLNTPAIYGLGTANDTAIITADHLFWNGVRTGNGLTGSGGVPYGSKAPAAILAGGAGTGTGTLTIQAKEITLGYDEDSRPTDGTTLDRVAIGFADVNLVASNRISGNSDGTLSVGQSKNASGALVGGNLNITTPLLTGQQGSTIDYKAGGAIRVVAGTTPADTSTVTDYGGTVSFTGDSVLLDTAVALPSGKLTLNGVNDVVLGSNAKIDLAGRTLAFFDQTKFTWGGDLLLSSTHGDISQSAGSVIDVSATYNQAGSIVASATDAAHGHVAFGGTLLGAASDGYRDGRFGVAAQTFGDFAALNTQLNAAGFFSARAFDLKQGDLVVGSEVKAQMVSISVDAGSLTVTGTIDASGAAPGSIRLAARDDLTLASSAVLDTHSTVLQTDSYGAPIEANNTAHVDLTTSQGTVVLTSGATIDMRSADGGARGKLEINAPRLGSTGASYTQDTGAGAPAAPANATGNDIAISAAGPLDIRGAASIALNGFATYSNAPADPDDANGQLIDQDWLNKIHQDSTVFYDAALANTDLQNRLAGLKAYGNAFHLRPGVTIASATPNGNLTTKGDLDFSNYRYGPGADTANHTGAGEVGVISFRAGGTLTVKGSINDGFAPPPTSPDALTTLLSGSLTDPFTVTTADVVLSGGWFTGIFDDGAPAVTLGVPLPLGPGFIILTDPTVNHPLPIDIPLAQDFTIGGFGGTTLGGEIRAADGTVLYHATDPVPLGAVIPAGSVLGAGIHDIGAYAGIFTTLTQWPANTDLYVTAGNPIDQAISLPVGTVLPVNFSLTDVTIIGPGDRKVWATSAMQAPGAQSWSMRLVGGADLAAADIRALQASSKLGSNGNVVLSDPFNVGLTGDANIQPGVSVVRTGTGDLEILAGGNYQQQSPFGVYTAGTAIPGTGAANDPYNVKRGLQADGTVLGYMNGDGLDTEVNYEKTLNAQRMYYTEHGGDFLLMAQGDIGGNLRNDSTGIGNWLLRQGGNGQATAWGINFGSYVGNLTGLGSAIALDAFSGMGTLGGGNVTLTAGRDIGNAGKGIVVAVGGSGRVMADGSLVQTGGGTLSVTAGRNVGTGGNQFVDLRGDTNVAAGSFGTLTANQFGTNGTNDPRPLDPLKTYAMASQPGGSFGIGDGVINLQTRGDLVMGTIEDPGRAGGQQAATGAPGAQQTAGTQQATWFTLWTPNTAVNLTATGGDVSPFSSDQTTAYLPSILQAVAANGDIYLTPTRSDAASMLMPSVNGALDLLARGSIIEPFNQGNAPVGALATSISSIATPFRPAWAERQFSGSQWTIGASNIWADPNKLPDSAQDSAYLGLFAFGQNTVTDNSATANALTSHIYAVNGDITGLGYGDIFTKTVSSGNVGVTTTSYRAAKLINIVAGGDIVNFRGVIVHDDPSDVSMIAAGGSVIYAGRNNIADAGLKIAGPGTLEVTAGKIIYQGSTASIESIGPLVIGDTRPGASVVLQAGVGAGTPGEGQVDWTDFAKLYLDPANLAGPGPLADQPGKVAKTYNSELMGWLKTRFGYAGSADDALTYFLALPPEQQRVFLRIVYYAELTAGGREFNDKSGPRPGSYLRGREAIAALFPHEGAYAGDITMFSSKAANSTKVLSGSVHTDFGGDIQFLAPGGGVTIGSEGLAPGADAGLITQGSGDIQIYSQDSILLGLSRIMTTFGGDILAWSDTGDINAGRGSKSTVIFTPPKRTYDDYGNIKLSPQVPSSGAGIATLSPIPGVPAGSVDLIAPLGTIDAGEAGIRSSGNVNLAALHIVNAANIQAQGNVTGVPQIQAPNIGGLTEASNTAGAAAQQAAGPRQGSGNAQPSIIIVEVLGFGGGDGQSSPPDENRRKDGRRTQLNDDPERTVRVLGSGPISQDQLRGLTDEEKMLLLSGERRKL